MISRATVVAVSRPPLIETSPWRTVRTGLLVVLNLLFVIASASKLLSGGGGFYLLLTVVFGLGLALWLGLLLLQLRTGFARGR